MRVQTLLKYETSFCCKHPHASLDTAAEMSNVSEQTHTQMGSWRSERQECSLRVNTVAPRFDVCSLSSTKSSSSLPGSRQTTGGETEFILPTVTISHTTCDTVAPASTSHNDHHHSIYAGTFQNSIQVNRSVSVCVCVCVCVSDRNRTMLFNSDVMKP